MAFSKVLVLSKPSFIILPYVWAWSFDIMDKDFKKKLTPEKNFSIFT